MPCERKHIEAIEKILDREINYIDPASELSLRAVINAALAACDESPWRSMDSAPKDETTVLLCFGDGSIEKALWLECYEEWVDSREYMILRNPTHWMHLPTAPGVE